MKIELVESVQYTSSRLRRVSKIGNNKAQDVYNERQINGKMQGDTNEIPQYLVCPIYGP